MVHISILRVQQFYQTAYTPQLNIDSEPFFCQFCLLGPFRSRNKCLLLSEPALNPTIWAATFRMIYNILGMT